MKSAPKNVNVRKAKSGLISSALNTGGIIFLNKFKYGSHKSRSADNGCRSQGMFGNQLSRTLTIKIPQYNLTHLRNPFATTVNGVLIFFALIAAKNNGPTAHTTVSWRLWIARSSSGLG